MFIEFLIAFLPIFTFFLCIMQLALLFAVKLVTEHAALTTARAAAVIIGDDKKRYKNEPANQLKVGSGARYGAIRDAALLTLSPYILDGTIESIDVLFPAPDTPGGPGRTGRLSYAPMSYSTIGKVRVRIELKATCKIAIANRIVCGSFGNLLRSTLGLRPTKLVRAEAIFPYQGARYDYPP